MRIGIHMSYSGGFLEAVDEIVDFERAGLDLVLVPEAYSFDAVSQMGFIAARTSRLQIGSGIMQLYSRTPTLTAMTAAGLDHVSGGRFVLGLGASGPQVVEGFHGAPYTKPLARMRDVVEICRKVWRREVLVHQGDVFTIPLPPEEGTGLGKPLRIINHPVRADIPIMIAAIGTRSVAQTAEIADAWQPLFYLPEKTGEIWGQALAAGRTRRDASLGELDVVVGAHAAVGDDVDHLKQQARSQIALYVGGMGARNKNFYNELACRYGFEEAATRVQELYLAGRKQEAEAAVPGDLVDRTSLIGPLGYVKERIEALRESGATTLNLTMAAESREERLRDLETIRGLTR